MSSGNGGEMEESQWDLFPQMIWIDPYLDDRATQYSKNVKRKRDSEELSDDGYLDDLADTPHGQHGISQNSSPYTTVLLPNGVATVKPISHLQGGVYSAQNEQRTALVAGNNLSLEQQDMSAIDGDKAFALSVTADMLALPENARAMVKAEIQNWLDNSRLSQQLESK
ncbi:unnamed protein product [Gongylonema pulchrum]|uniref:BESS domain-containing protein n=1 Tax=Gongylonema pulchrum TaxID=637853 RepID=A0A183DWK4_9BILA|nr:unnamed protein product [Gongylonema pulchrum]